MVRVLKNKSVLDYHMSLNILTDSPYHRHYLIESFSEKPLIDHNVTMLVEFQQRIIHLEIVSIFKFSIINSL